MKLSLKQKALLLTGLNVVGIIVSAVVGATIVANVPASTLFNALGVGLVVWCIYMIYGITLSQLEYKQKLQEMVDEKSKL